MHKKNSEKDWRQIKDPSLTLWFIAIFAIFVVTSLTIPFQKSNNGERYQKNTAEETTTTVLRTSNGYGITDSGTFWDGSVHDTVGQPWDGPPCQPLVFTKTVPDGADPRLDKVWNTIIVPQVQVANEAGLNMAAGTKIVSPATSQEGFFVTFRPDPLSERVKLSTTVPLYEYSMLGKDKAYAGISIRVIEDSAKAHVKDERFIFYVQDSNIIGKSRLDGMVVYIDSTDPQLSAQLVRHAMAAAAGLDPRNTPHSVSGFDGQLGSGRDGAETLTPNDITAMREASGCEKAEAEILERNSEATVPTPNLNATVPTPDLNG